MSVLPDRFLNKKHPHSAGNSTSFVSRQVPQNVQSCPASTTINFRIGTMPNCFIDCQNSALRWKIKNNTPVGTAQSATFTLGSAGAPGVFETINLLNSGSQLSHYQNYGVFRSMKNALGCTSDWIKGPGHIMQGTAPSSDADIGLIGASLGPGEERVFIDPLCNHATLFNQPGYVSLDLIDNLDLRYTIGDAGYGGAWSGDGVTSVSDQSLIFYDFELILSVVQLSSSTVSQLMSAHTDGNICYNCRGVGRVSATIPAGVSAHTVNLGLGYSSLMALNSVQLPLYKGGAQTTPIDRIQDHQNSTFVRNYLSKYQFLIDGSPIENQRPVKGDPAEIAMFQQIAQGTFHRFDGAVVSNANGGALDAYINDAETGTNLSGSKGAIVSNELCIYKQKGGTWHDNTMSLCEGRGVLASSSQIALEFAPNSGKEVQLECFPEYLQLIVLDANTKTYRVSQ